MTRNFIKILGQEFVTMTASDSADIYLTNNGYEHMYVGYDAFIGTIEPRWEIQECHVPPNKKGKLKKYAGKRVHVIPTNIGGTAGGMTIQFYIKEIVEEKPIVS